MSTFSAAEISAFRYRSPRMECHLPVEFSVCEGSLFGVATNISEQGLLVRFDEPTLPGTVGRVRIRIERCLLELEAEITHTEGFLAGIAFLFASEKERSFVRALIQVIVATQRDPVA